MLFSSLEHLVESGIVKHKMRDGLPDTQICPLNLGSKERQLRITDLLLTYYIVAGGFILSGVVFVSEIILKHAKKLKPQNRLERVGKDGVLFPPAPPPYHTLFGAPEKSKKKKINGRDYWVMHSDSGESNLVPIRTPSALLFQYTH